MDEKREPMGETGVLRAAALVLIVVPFFEILAMAHQLSGTRTRPPRWWPS
jgi:hypothetical protein